MNNDDDDDDDVIANIIGGSYVDLGTIPFDNDETLLSSTSLLPLPSRATKNTIERRKSEQNNNPHQYWIVIIDDEPSIRLAIGDYLHSMGYTNVTACDGPQSFLDVLLYSCGWSFLSGAPPPPWMNTIATTSTTTTGDESIMMMPSWRLPNCIISDIRMPGGVDGVQLLELLRQRSNDDNDIINSNRSRSNNNNNNSKSTSKDDNDSGADNVKKSGKKKTTKKGRRRKDEEERRNNEYDGKDDFELLDAIVGSGGGGSNNNVGSSNSSSSSSTITRMKQQQQLQQEAGKIVTAIDQAMQKLTVISDTLTYLQTKKATCNSNSPMQQQQQQQQQMQIQQYPNTLTQIPVILLTAKAMVSDRIVGFKAGANNYLPKPFRPEELLGMVDSLMRKQELERKEWIRSNSDYLMGGSSDNSVAAVNEKHNNNEEEVVVKHVDDDELFESYYYSASAQQVKDLTTELIEIKNLLKEEAQRQKSAKVERGEVERLAKLLPEALWMFMNGERRKRLFTTDHIRSILIFCFDDAAAAALTRKSIVKRDTLLAELERRNDENPDLLQDDRLILHIRKRPRSNPSA